MIYIHNSLRKYIVATLNFFNEVKVQNKNSEGDIVEKNIPVEFSTKEKLDSLSNLKENGLLNGNINYLPRAFLTFNDLARDESRMRNRNNKINILHKDSSIEYQYNSIPYTLSLSYKVLCRGMNEACQIIEEVVPYFNPILNLDVYDGDNISEPSRIPILLTGTSVEQESYEEFSNNTITVNFDLSLAINMYMPVKKIENIKRYKLSLHGQEEQRYKTIGYDVENSYVVPESKKEIDRFKALSDLEIGFKTKEIFNGKNTVYNFIKKNKLDDIKNFNWTVLQSEIEVLEVKTGKIIINVPEDYKGDVEIIFEVEDAFENKQACSRLFKVK